MIQSDGAGEIPASLPGATDMTANNDWKAEFLAKQAAIKARAAAMNAAYGHGSTETRKPVTQEVRQGAASRMAVDAFRKTGRK